MDNDLSIPELVREVSEQLIMSRAQRLARGETALLELTEVSLEISFVVTSSAGASGGFDLKVIKAESNGRYDQQSIQRVTLKLKPLEGDISILTELEEEPAGFRPRLHE